MVITSKQVTCLQGHISDLLGKSSDCSKKVYKATMYIPNLALGLTGEVIVCTKDLVFALHQVNMLATLICLELKIHGDAAFSITKQNKL